MGEMVNKVVAALLTIAASINKNSKETIDAYNKIREDLK